MAKMWEPKDPELLKSWIRLLREEPSEDLTPWEENFVNDMSLRLEYNNPLTQYQEEKLEQIYAEKTS